MTDDELKKIEARANAATRGPWNANFVSDPVTVFGGECDCRGYPDSVAVASKPEPDPLDEKCTHIKWIDNMRFIAHAREDVPALVAEVRRLREAISAVIVKLEYAETRIERVLVDGKADAADRVEARWIPNECLGILDKALGR